MNLEALLATPLDARTKGIPPTADGVRLGDLGQQGWNVLAEDLPLPLAVLKEPALRYNSDWMRRFLSGSGASLCPHGKTTMSPQLFARQLADGAWGITLATAQQIVVARRFGVPRVLLANQLVGRQAIRAVLHELAADPHFDFYCLVDSVAGACQLADAAQDFRLSRPVQVLVEAGIEGARTGCRTISEAVDVARYAADRRELALRGVEGFEGVIRGTAPEQTEEQVVSFLDRLVELARACDREQLFAPGEVVLSAGGSVYFDLVVRRFSNAQLGQPARIVLRSGCYLTHDALLYRRAFERLQARSTEARELGAGLEEALELWACVQSRPEPGRAILSFGRRDASFDAGLPVPRFWFRHGRHPRPEPLRPEHQVVALNDQHALVDVPAGSPLAVGDLVGCGISHPCTTFDKWRFLPIVDADYRVVDGILTFF